ncbi:MAG: hypothetical protein ACRYG8_34370, partial [Janthinobacterium lividum]
MRAHSASAHADLFEPAFEADGVFTTRIGAVEGHLEQLSTTGAKGWAWLPDQPAVSVELTAVLDGRTVGRGVADIMRSDLFSSRRGTGRYGFELAFEEPVSDIERLSVEVLQKGCSIPLPILPSALQNRSDKPPTIIKDMHRPRESHPSFRIMATKSLINKRSRTVQPMVVGKDTNHNDGPYSSSLNKVSTPDPEAFPQVQGFIDEMTLLGASGWAWVPTSPATSVEIEAVFEG